VTVCYSHKLLALKEVDLKFSTDVVFRVLNVLFGNKSMKFETFYGSFRLLVQ